MPEAMQLKEKAAWKANRVYVNKDAQKVIILEPGKEYTREDGSKAVGYNAKEVYDISQTSAAGKKSGAGSKIHARACGGSGRCKSCSLCPRC